MASRSLQVLVVVPGPITSTDIRIYLPLNRLVEKGGIRYRVEYLHELPRDAVHGCDVVLIQKTSSPKGLDLLEEAKLYGKPVIYEIDDNLIDPLPPYHPVHGYYCRAVRNLVERSIRKADLVTVSTEALRVRFSEFHDQVRVVPNTVDFRFVNHSKNGTARTRVGYSGTKTHKGDFEVVLPALKRLAVEYKEKLSLVFLGYLPEELQGFKGIEEWQYTYAYSEYLQRLGSLGIDIAIAPLSDELFNKYKSNIKYVEYSASGIAGVYTRCAAYADSVRHGVTGLLVEHTEEAWYTSIKTLIDDPFTRKKLAAASHEDVSERFSIHKACEAWEGAFSQVLATGPKAGRGKKTESPTGVKKIFYIGSGFLWPHTYIDDFLVTAFASLGLEVLYYPILPTPFHKEALALYNNFDPEFIKYTLSGAIPADQLLQCIKREKPDLLFCIQGYMIPRDVLYEISKCGIPSAVWFMDEPYDAARSIPLGTFFHYVFLQDSSTVGVHRRHGNPNAHYLPHGFDDREVHIHQESNEFVWDLSLVGMGFPRRREAVSRIIGKGNTLLAGGNWDGFESHERVVTRGVVRPQEAAEIYRRTRINLSIHRAEDDHATSTFPCRAVSPNGSLFYVAGCGGFQLADDTRKEVEDFFEPGREIVLYHSLDDLQDKVDFYLKHDAERQAISRAARRRAVAEHTYRHRLKRMLEIVEAGANASAPRFFQKSVLFACEADRGHLFRGEDVQVITFNGSDSAGTTILRGERTDTSTALNAAFFEASSPYTAVTTSSTPKLRGKLSLSMDCFTKSPDLGAVVFRTDEGRLTLSVVSNRILWRLGAFTRAYWGIESAMKDLLLRLRERGFGVVTQRDTEIPGKDPDEITAERVLQDEKTFRTAWGSHPEARLKAKKLIGLSYTLKGKEKREVVRALCEKALALDPDYPDACREWGSLLLEDGKLEVAREYLEKAWLRGENDVPAGILYSLYLIAIKKETDAIELLQRLAGTDTSPREKTSILFNMGRCHKRLGDTKEAVDHFKKALDFDPNYVQIFRELFSIYVESNDLRAALDCTEKITKLQPDNAEALNDMGVLLYTLGRKVEAFEALKRAVGLDGGHRDALENLRQVAQSLGIPPGEDPDRCAAKLGNARR